MVEIRPNDYAEKEKVALENAEGRIPANIIMPYPPGIPVVALGDKITAEHISQIKALQDLDVNIIGIEDNEILVVKN